MNEHSLSCEIMLLQKFIETDVLGEKSFLRSKEMARRTFFSFHYEQDIWRANVVRNSWVTQDAVGFWDASLWEEAKRKGDAAIKRMIDDGLYNTSVTIVLIGAETSEREYVQYEISQSFSKGNGMLGIKIHNIKDRDGNTDYSGSNPFSKLQTQGGINLSKLYNVYDWFGDDGYNNLSDWIEVAAQNAGR